MSDLKNAQSPLVQIDFDPFEKAQGIQLSELAFQGHLNLRGRPDNVDFMTVISDVTGVQLPLTPNTFIEQGEFKIYWLGPDEWLIVTPPDQQTELESSLQKALQGIFSSVTDISSGQTIIRLSGENARAVLQKGCTIDIHPRAFNPGDCAQTRLAKTGIMLSAVDDTPSFDIIVRRSFSDYLGLWLLDAVEEFSV